MGGLMSKNPAKVSTFYAEEREVPGMGALSLFTDSKGRIMGI